MMIKAILIAVIVSILGVNPSSVRAQQAFPFDLKLESMVQLEYRPFSGLASMETLSIDLESVSASREDREGRRNRRALALRITTLQSNGEFVLMGKRRALPVEFIPLRNTNPFRLIDDSFEQEVSINPNASQFSQEYQILIPESQFAEPDKYSLPLQIELFDKQSNAVLLSEQVDIQAFVPPKLLTSIAGTTRSPGSLMPMIDFGTLDSGDTREVSVQVRANTRAQITVSSENQGRLKLIDEDGYVDYSINLDGQNSPLSTPLVLNRDIAKTIRGSAFPMQVKIGEVERAFAGRYEDVITIEVRPQ